MAKSKKKKIEPKRERTVVLTPEAAAKWDELKERIGAFNDSDLHRRALQLLDYATHGRSSKLVSEDGRVTFHAAGEEPRTIFHYDVEHGDDD